MAVSVQRVSIKKGSQNRAQSASTPHSMSTKRQATDERMSSSEQHPERDSTRTAARQKCVLSRVFLSVSLVAVVLGQKPTATGSVSPTPPRPFARSRVLLGRWRCISAVLRTTSAGRSCVFRRLLAARSSSHREARSKLSPQHPPFRRRVPRQCAPSDRVGIRDASRRRRPVTGYHAVAREGLRERIRPSGSDAVRLREAERDLSLLWPRRPKVRQALRLHDGAVGKRTRSGSGPARRALLQGDSRQRPNAVPQVSRHVRHERRKTTPTEEGTSVVLRRTTPISASVHSLLSDVTVIDREACAQG